MATSESELMKEARTIMVPVEQLQLDPGNVRFQHLQKVLTDKEIEEVLWKESDTEKLYYQIRIAGGLHEEPIIKSTDGGKYLVIEGNRRIVCIRRLQKEAKKRVAGVSADHYDKIKCKLLPDNITGQQIDLYLAMVHVKSKKPWATFNRAKHVTSLHDTHGMSYDKLSKYLGMGKITVIRFVDSYNATLAYGKKYRDDTLWHRRFTYFDELYRRRSLKDFRENEGNLEKFSRWIYEKKFRDHKDVRSLDKIIANPKALEKFERGGFLDAMKTVEADDPSVKSREFKKIKESIETITSFSRKELLKTAFSEPRMMMLKKLKSELTSLINDLEDIRRRKK